MSEKAQNPFRILWIEDQFGQLQEGVDEVKRVLTADHGLNIEIVSARTITNAEEALRASAKPNVILLDIMLPRDDESLKAGHVDMNGGYLIWYRLRKGSNSEYGRVTRQVPIVVVTARARPAFRAQMETDDKLKWLEKPVAPSEIANAIVGLTNVGRGGRV